MLSNVQTHYRKVTKERPQNPETFVKIIFPAFFEPVSAALCAAFNGWLLFFDGLIRNY